VHAVDEEGVLNEFKVGDCDLGEPGRKEIETSVNDPVAAPVFDASVTANGTE